MGILRIPGLTIGAGRIFSGRVGVQALADPAEPADPINDHLDGHGQLGVGAQADLHVLDVAPQPVADLEGFRPTRADGAARFLDEADRGLHLGPRSRDHLRPGLLGLEAGTQLVLGSEHARRALEDQDYVIHWRIRIVITSDPSEGFEANALGGRFCPRATTNIRTESPSA